MIHIAKLVTEKRSESSIDKGCLMADVSPEICKKLVEFGKKIIPESDLYVEGDEFGRELECHITVLYGFTRNLTELEVRRIINGVKPFTIKLSGLSKFTPPEKFEVVKFDVESEILTSLNKKCQELPFESDFPDYHPHLTIAYVKKGKFNHTKEGLSIEIPINRFTYSTATKEKTYYNL